MTRVEELHQLSDLAPYRLRWQRLLGETRGATYWQSLDWLENYLHHAPELELKVLSISHGRQALGIMPLVVTPRRTPLGVVRQLSYPLVPPGSFYGPIGPNPTATLTAGLRHLRETGRDWDVLELAGINASHDRGRTEHALRRAGFRPIRRVQSTRAIVDFSATWPSYLGSRSPQLRQRLRLSEDRLKAQGNWQYLHYRPEGSACGDDDPRWELYYACEPILLGNSAATASEHGVHHQVNSPRSSPRPPSTDSARAMLRDMHRRAAASGNVDLHLLQVGGRPAACVYGYHLHGHAAAHMWGLDDQLSPEDAQAAETVLLARCLESCCRAGDHSYDLGMDAAPGRRDWMTRPAICESYTHFARGPRSQLLRWSNVVQNWRRGASQVAIE